MGNKQYGYGLSYESGIVMLKAWVYKFSKIGEGGKENNHCQNNFPKTTHVIKVLFNAPMFKDGVHPLIPSDT